MYYSNIIIPFNPSDCFVLELLVQNLSYNPRIVREFFMQLEDKHDLDQFQFLKRESKDINAENGFKKSLEGEESILHKQENCTKNQ